MERHQTFHFWQTQMLISMFFSKSWDDIVNDAKVISNVFNQYFSTVASKIRIYDYLTESENIGSIVDSY